MTRAIKRIDWLLGATTGLCWAILVLLGIGFGALLMAIPSLFFFSTRIFAEIAANNPAVTIAERPWIAGILMGAAVILGLAFLFIRTLLDIVNSVGTGDPLTSENAARLETMGWLGIGVQVAGAITAMVAWPVAKLAPQVHVDFGVDLSGVVLILLLFILARIFRAGAAMRADLEGTV